jgi:phage terminase large subunit-like protein
MGCVRLNPGDRAVRWISNLTLSDDHKGRPFTLRPWQSDGIVRPIFGTLRPDGLRVYREAFLFLPRKQAKTQLTAAIGDYCLLGDVDSRGDRREGQQIVCAASDRGQASHLFKKSCEMIEAEPELLRRVKIYYAASVIEEKRTGNVLKVISSEGRRQHGLNPSVVLFDEIHTQPNTELYDALTSAQATRQEPLNVYITTAGNRRDALWHDLYQYAKKCQADPAFDPAFLPVIYEAARDADWTDESVWFEAMPALGDFASLDYIRDQCRKAKESASEESKFRQLFLNQLVASSQKWLRPEAWKACGRHPVVPDELEGREAYMGLDLSAVSDITAAVLVFPMDDGETLKVLCRFWIPRAYAEERDRKGRTQYTRWARDGWITLTDGDVIDYREIEDAILELADRYDVRNILVDPFNAMQTTTRLINEGLPVELMRQGPISMNAPIKHMEVLISRGKLHHGQNPVLDWMADNVVSETDVHMNVKFSKKTSADKIDGMVALAMGTQGALAAALRSIPGFALLNLPAGQSTNA